MMEDNYFGLVRNWQTYDATDSAGEHYTIHASQLVFCPDCPLYDMFILVKELGKDRYIIRHSVRVHGSNKNITSGEREVSSGKGIINKIIGWYKDGEGSLPTFCGILELIGCSGSITLTDQEGWIKYNNA